MTPTTLDLQQTLEYKVGRMQHIERRECPYYSSFHIEELEVLLSDGTTLEIIFKNLSPQGVLEGARVKPDFLYDPLREIEAYRTVLCKRSLGTARYFGSLTDDDRCWLFLERVQGTHLWQTGDLEAWRNAARWLEQLHRQPANMPRLLRYDRAYYERGWRRALALHPELRSIEPIFGRAIDSLLKLPTTFIHGEFYASNVLLQGSRICPVDWEMAGCGPGLIDLAALTAGNWDEQQRLDFTSAYCGGVQPSGEVLHTLECCRLHLAIRLLGWPRDWQPPATHANDWCREALEIAGGLA